MSPTRTRRWLPAVVVPVLVIAAGLAVFLGRDASSTTATGAGDPAGATGAGPAAATSPATGTAPYTIKPEPTFVASDPPPPPATGPEVVLTFAGYEPSTGTVRANGFIAGVVQEGASCTLTLTNGDREISTSSAAEADATTTSCGLLETEADVPSGTWEATLSYSGTRSSSMEVVVP